LGQCQPLFRKTLGPLTIPSERLQVRRTHPSPVLHHCHQSPDPPGQDSQESVSIPQIPLSPHFEEKDKGLEPTTSSQKSVIDDIDIPATWLKVEDFWLNLHVDDEPAALNTALDFMMQLQNLSK
jgi:hypothetical protein